METYSYDEAIYGVLCYIFGEMDNTEKEVIQNSFNKRHSLSFESMKDMYFMCSLRSDDSFQDVIDSLKNYSLSKRLKAYETICIVINKYQRELPCPSRPELWEDAYYIMQCLRISREEYDRYIKE